MTKLAAIEEARSNVKRELEEATHRREAYLAAAAELPDGDAKDSLLSQADAIAHRVEHLTKLSSAWDAVHQKEPKPEPTKVDADG